MKQTKKQIKQEILAKLSNEIDNDDYEQAHGKADDLLCELLIKLGHQDIVDVYNKINKWYA